MKASSVSLSMPWNTRRKHVQEVAQSTRPASLAMPWNMLRLFARSRAGVSNSATAPASSTMILKHSSGRYTVAVVDALCFVIVIMHSKDSRMVK